MSVMNFQPAFRDVKPPDKGAFPLDHEGECKEFMIKYMGCLRENQLNNSVCRDQAKDYLQCRMDRYAVNSDTIVCCGDVPDIILE